MDASWDVEIGKLLTDLSAVQQELLDLLGEKRRRLMNFDNDGIAALQPREQDLASRLSDCHQRRLDLLRRAGAAGLPSDNLRSLASALPASQRKALTQPTREAAIRARLLAHQGLANWVFVQRTLLHLSGLLEIIATGGRLQPTYSKGENPSQSAGSFLDQAA